MSRLAPLSISRKQRFVSTSSRQIQPLISTEAFSALPSVIPGRGLESAAPSAHLPSRTVAASRLWQVLLTAVPLAVADLVAVAGCYLAANAFVQQVFQSRHNPGLWNNLLALCVSYLLVGEFLGLFPASGINPVRELRNLIRSAATAFVLQIVLNTLVGEFTRNELLTVVLAFPLSFLVLPICRFSSRKLLQRFAWWGEKVIIVGSGKHGRIIHRFLSRQPQRGLKPLGVVDETPADYWNADDGSSLEFLGTTEELVQICRTRNCHWVIAAVCDKSREQILEILNCGSLIPNLVVLNTNLMVPSMWVESFDAAGMSGIHVRDRLLFPIQRVFKRLIDIVLSAFLLGLFSPVAIALILWAKCAHKSSVFYCHQRVGRYGKPFGAWKFTTMVPDAPRVLKEYLAHNETARREWEEFHKLKQDPRVIQGFGEFMRRTSLDELPQLWNVLRGEMSLVGPRPVYTLDEVEMYGDLYPLYLRVRPGLTGLWQVSGRNNTSFADKVWLDTYYSVNWSLWLDYFILLRTVRTVLMREGSC